MARRKKSRRRRSPKTISLLNLVESYAYASVISGGIMANTPVGLLGFDGAGGAGYTGTSMTTNGGSAITLASIVSDPGTSLDAMQANLMANYQAMAVSAIGISISFKLAKKLLAKPLRSINKNLVAPLGIGVRI